MVIRQIRTNMRKAIEGLAEPAEGLGDAWANGMKNIGQAYCDVWQQSPQFIKQNPVGGFIEGAMGNMCNRDNDQPDPPPIDLPDSGDPFRESLPFSGGQCEGNSYQISITYTWKRCSTGDTFTVSDSIGSIYGAIQEIFYGIRDGGDGFEWGVKGFDSSGNPTTRMGGGMPTSPNVSMSKSCPDDVSLIIAEFTIDEVRNIDNPADDCGDPPPPPEQPEWRDPDPEPPQPPPINLPSPPGYPDGFPSPEINITFNPTTKNFEGDKFTVKLQPPDIVFEYDDEDPPEFLDDGSPDSDLKLGEPPPLALPDLDVPQFPDISFPEVIGDGIERITDFIPTPLPGVTVGDILDKLQECIAGEDSEPLNTIQIPYYQCESKKFENATLEATESSINNFPLDLFTETANNASLWCDEPEVRIGYPDWWAVRVGANRPQLVIIFRKDATRNYCSLVIPHYAQEPAPETSPLGSYQAGNVMGRETLVDNSKLTVYASSATEANRVLDEMAAVVKSEMRYSPPWRTIQERQGNPVETSERIPRVVEVWAKGRATGSAPTKAWKVPPFNEPTP